MTGSTLQSGTNISSNASVIERFLPLKLHCTCSQRLQAHFFVAMRGDEDDRNPAMFAFQLRLPVRTDIPAYGFPRSNMQSDAVARTSGILSAEAKRLCRKFGRFAANPAGRCASNHRHRHRY